MTRCTCGWEEGAPSRCACCDPCVCTKQPHCPGCGSHLVDCVGVNEEEVYDAVRCPKGCDLWELFDAKDAQ